MAYSVAARTHAHMSVLEDHATRAGSAWACVYSSSAEFDAALIAARRAAGVYGPRRRRRRIAAIAGLAAALAALILLAV